MDRPIIRDYGKGPEAKIQAAVIEFLERRQWFVKVLHGNRFQQGMPDLFACKNAHGYRFIECKQPVKYMFTQAQVDFFPKMAACGVGIWIMNSATQHEYETLYRQANWWSYFEATKIRSGKAKIIEAPEAKGPEAIIQEKILKSLADAGWHAKALHGDLFQYGMPDIFACKKGFGWRFIEVKNPASYSFTNAQRQSFPRLQSEGIGVWILTSETQLHKLMEPANWHQFLDGAK